MKPIQSVLITGANAGLGREAARQLALRNGIEKIYLACRNLPTKLRLQNLRSKRQRPARTIFEIVLMDVSNPSFCAQCRRIDPRGSSRCSYPQRRWNRRTYTRTN